jgi:hypothetical protein
MSATVRLLAKPSKGGRERETASVILRASLERIIIIVIIAFERRLRAERMIDVNGERSFCEIWLIWQNLLGEGPFWEDN